MALNGHLGFLTPLEWRALKAACDFKERDTYFWRAEDLGASHEAMVALMRKGMLECDDTVPVRFRPTDYGRDIARMAG